MFAKIYNVPKDLKSLVAVKLPIELGRFNYEAKFMNVMIIDPVTAADDQITFSE